MVNLLMISPVFPTSFLLWYLFVIVLDSECKKRWATGKSTTCYHRNSIPSSDSQWKLSAFLIENSIFSEISHRFVTYLLTFPRIIEMLKYIITLFCTAKIFSLMFPLWLLSLQQCFAYSKILWSFLFVCLFLCWKQKYITCRNK